MRQITAHWIGLLWIASMPVSALEITLPAETASFRPSPLPGFGLVQPHCLSCHSADYVASQPPDSTREYWEHTVAKMKTAFGAPIPDADIPSIIDYLAKTYGPERDTAAYPASSGDDSSKPAPR